jgi:hypothetical protein
VAGLSIFYYRRRRHQYIFEKINDARLTFDMEIENPATSDL